MAVTTIANGVQTKGRQTAEGYARTTLNSDTAETVSRASGKTGIWVQVESGEVSINAAGDTATTTSGELLGQGYAERYDVASVSVIETTAEAIIRTWSE